MHRFGNLVLHVIDPVDLAVSKVARFSERDREDIRALAVRGLIDLGTTFAVRRRRPLPNAWATWTSSAAILPMPWGSSPRPGQGPGGGE